MISCDSITRACAFATLALAASPAAAFWPFTSEADALVEACEEVLMGRLKAPSTYEQVKVSPVYREPGTEDEFLGYTMPGDKEEDLAEQASDPKVKEMRDRQKELFALVPEKVYLFLTYEAANSFGAPLRGVAECSAYTAKGEDFRDLRFPDVRVNGQTHMGWLLDQM